MSDRPVSQDAFEPLADDQAWMYAEPVPTEDREHDDDHELWLSKAVGKVAGYG